LNFVDSKKTLQEVKETENEEDPSSEFSEDSIPIYGHRERNNKDTNTKMGNFLLPSASA